jgi:hypothetical protein
MHYATRYERLRHQAGKGYANPSQMLKLLDEVERLRKENKELHEANRELREALANLRYALAVT